MKNFFVLFFVFFTIFSISGYAQSNSTKSRKRKIVKNSGGFIPCTVTCSLHSRNCTFMTGYHEATYRRKDNGEIFCTYNGHFVAGRPQGQGEYHNADGSLDYIGTYNYGFFNNGKLTNKYGDTLIGHFTKDDKKWYLETGYISSSRWYTLADNPDDLQRTDRGDKIFVRGYIKDGKLHGHVYFKILEGDYAGTEFDGQFVEGHIKGCGIMKIYRNDNFLSPSNTSSKDCYIAFKSLNPSGDIYIGQWDNCTYGGWGVLSSQQYATSYGYWNNNKVSNDIPFSIVTQTIEDLCHFNFDWSQLNPGLDSSSLIMTIPSMPDLGDDGNFTTDISNAQQVDNRGNVDNGVQIKFSVNYLKIVVGGDYASGKYDLNSSSNAKALLHALDTAIIALSQKVLDSLNYDLIDTSTQLTFKITATTDRSSIGRRGINYEWEEFGLKEQYDDVYYVLDDLNTYSITKSIKIKEKLRYNSQLAFLRAMGIENFIADSLNLNTNKITYKFQIDTTSSHRTIGVEMFINNTANYQNPRIQLTRKVEDSAPQNSTNNNNAGAIIMYLTKYRDPTISTDGLIYAQKDAMLVKEYLNKTLAIPTSNIKISANDNLLTSDIKRIFTKTILNMARNGVTDFFVYYQGHGFANNKKQLYLMPYNIRTNANGAPETDDLDSLAGYLNTATKIAKDSANTDINFYVIFDACASYQATKYAGRKFANTKPNSSCIISASQMYTTAKYDKTLQHSLLSYGFCYALFDYTSTDVNSDGKLSFQEIFYSTKKFVQEQSAMTSIDSSGIQIPGNYGNGKWEKNMINTSQLRK